MGKRGPRPTPTVALKLRGSKDVGGRRAGEIEPPAGLPEPPQWLNFVEREVWDQTIADLSRMPGLMTFLDRDMLASYCEAWGDFFEARAEIERDGPTCHSDKGGAYQHPAVGRKNSALERIRKLAAEFGMSPASRTSVKVTPMQADTSKKKFFA